LDAVHDELLIMKKSIIALGKPRIVRVLHIQPVIPRSDSRGLLSLDRLTTVSRELTNFRIHVETVTSSAFPNSYFDNPRFLTNTFDVIFIGGTDSCCHCLPGITKEVINRTFQQYHIDGGNVVFLHDVLFPSDWQYFQTKIGPYKSEYTEARYCGVRVKDGADSEVLRTPCSLPEKFPVCTTHSGQIHVADGAILVGDDGEGCPYYHERDGIAVCEAGCWEQKLTACEWQLFVNITIHMSTKRPRKIEQ
jgi:hypothetical protein